MNAHEVSDESGLGKIPQLAVRDTSGSPIPGYFNVWRWILPAPTPAERGGRRGHVKPEAVLTPSCPATRAGAAPARRRRSIFETRREPCPVVKSEAPGLPAEPIRIGLWNQVRRRCIDSAGTWDSMIGIRRVRIAALGKALFNIRPASPERGWAQAG